MKGRALGRKLLTECANLVTPETILAWHRRLVALIWTFRRRNVGRLSISQEVRALILELARNDSNWGDRSIRDRLSNLGHQLSRATVASVLREHGIEPAPKRRKGMSWSTFLKAHWPQLAAIDFTTVEVWTKGGLVTHYVLFVMELATRKVTCAGITPYPNAAWMLQIGRNLTDGFSGFLQGKRFLIMDRDSSFHEAFRGLFEQAGTAAVRTPPNSPNCNSYIERFHGSFKREVADRMIFLGEDHLQRSIDDYLEYYHHERNHQGARREICRSRHGNRFTRRESSPTRAARRHAQLLLSRSCVSAVRIFGPHGRRTMRDDGCCSRARLVGAVVCFIVFDGPDQAAGVVWRYVEDVHPTMEPSADIRPRRTLSATQSSTRLETG